MNDWSPSDALVEAARDAFLCTLVSGAGLAAAVTMAMVALMLHVVRRTWHRAEATAL